MQDLSNAAKELGARGGSASIKAQFAGKAKEEISKEMRRRRGFRKYKKGTKV